jgi:hypothetical protein
VTVVRAKVFTGSSYGHDSSSKTRTSCRVGSHVLLSEQDDHDARASPSAPSGTAEEGPSSYAWMDGAPPLHLA